SLLLKVEDAEILVRQPLAEGDIDPATRAVVVGRGHVHLYTLARQRAGDERHRETRPSVFEGKGRDDVEDLHWQTVLLIVILIVILIAMLTGQAQIKITIKMERGQSLFVLLNKHPARGSSGEAFHNNLPCLLAHP